MLSLVIERAKNLQVLDAVVILDGVLVVDGFAPFERSSQLSRHDESMFKHVAARVYHRRELVAANQNVAILIRNAATLPGVVSRATISVSPAWHI